MAIEKVGFIGLGNMGIPMANNLIQAGHEVYGMDINEASKQKFKELGGIIVDSIKELTEKTKFIMTSLPTPKIVESIYCEKNGLIDSAEAGTLLIDFSTVNPKLNDDIAALCKRRN